MLGKLFNVQRDKSAEQPATADNMRLRTQTRGDQEEQSSGSGKNFDWFKPVSDNSSPEQVRKSKGQRAGGSARRSSYLSSQARSFSPKRRLQHLNDLQYKHTPHRQDEVTLMPNADIALGDEHSKSRQNLQRGLV